MATRYYSKNDKDFMDRVNNELVGDLTSNQDGIINILDVIGVVGEILGTTFRESVEWLEENFPQLKTKERLSKLDKSKYFIK